MSNQNPNKVLFLINSAPEFAGVQRYILNAAKGLKTSDWNVVVWLNKNPSFAQKLNENQIPYYEYSGSVLSLKNLLTLLVSIRHNKIQVLHANLGGSAIAGALLKYPAGIKRLVFTQHFLRPASSQSNFLKKFLAKIIFKFSFYFFDQCIAISNEVKKQMLDRKEVSLQKITVIFNGSEELKGDINRNKIPDILIVSRLQKEKGIEEILPVFTALKQQGLIFKVNIVGTGELETVLKKKCRELGLTDIIIFAGLVNNVIPYYFQSSIFLNPTLLEGFGLAIIEAMSARLPVIAYAYGGPLDIVDDGKTGFLVHNIKEMTTSLKQLIEDKNLREQMGEEGYTRFKSLFSLDIMIEKLLKIYQGIQ
ncbi:MAG: glycosyltransferase family 4 protein [Candidatus Margulisbacteria bacterium]|nr:glycosyltransferase family 4 protein [Candidatus Margulisiibacteriota bacterium]